MVNKKNIYLYVAGFFIPFLFLFLAWSVNPN